MAIDSSFEFTASNLKAVVSSLFDKMEATLTGVVNPDSNGWDETPINESSNSFKATYAGHGTFEAAGSNLNADTRSFSVSKVTYTDDASTSDGVDASFDLAVGLKGTNSSTATADNTVISGSVSSGKIDDGSITMSFTGSLAYSSESGVSVNISKGREFKQLVLTDNHTHAYVEIDGEFGGDGDDSGNGAAVGEIKKVVFFDGTTTYTYSGEEIDLADLTSGTIGQFFTPVTVDGGTGTDTLTGGGSDDILDGGAGDDSLVGGIGSDTLEGGAGDDQIGGGTGDDHLDGGDGDDILDGGTGNDILDGGNGNNLLDGGVGTDTVVLAGTLSDYSISVVKGTLTFLTFTGLKAGDIVVLTATDGQVNKIVNIEQVQFAGDGSTLNVTKASLLASAATYANDKLTGDASDNDMAGLGGNDTLTGAAGNDTLDGGTGNDKLTGGLGDDSYYVDAAKDAVTEKAGEGTDTIIATVSYTLAKEVETLTLASSGGDIAGTGNTGANTVTGNSGANSINGMLGNDTLAGGSGNDTFVFNTKLNGLSNVDTISDFTSGTDAISLSKKIFTAYKTIGADLTNDLVSGAGATALDTTDHFIYDTATGNLYYDQDGSGTKSAEVLFATLTGLPTLAASDLHII